MSSQILAASMLTTVALLCGPVTAQTTVTAEIGLAELGTATHVIIPQSRSFPLRPRPQNPDLAAAIQIESVAAEVTIIDQTATTTLQVGLVNTSARQDEAVLLLPVPPNAVVNGFAFEGSASEPTAEVLPAEEARRLYDQIVNKVLDPALLEFAGYNLVRSSVFPVPANGRQRVQLTYETLLERDGDRVDYFLPRSESLDQRRPWQITVRVEAAAPIASIYSPSHELDVNRISEQAFSVELDAASVLQPGAFRLSYLLKGGGVPATVFAYPDPAVGGGYFLLMASPPTTIDESARMKREVTVVIDRSGSMAGAKMDQVRAAALQIIEGLSDGEAFNIIDYSTAVASFAAAPVIKDQASTGDARAYLETIRPGGGTNIHDALVEALRQPTLDGMLPLVLFLTDGLPTIGQTGEVAIRQVVEQGNSARRRVFTFGVGHDVNVPLLDRIADVSRATSTFVRPEEDVELKVAKVFRRLYGPILADPTLTAYDVDGVPSTRLMHDQIPAVLPDCFEGDQLLVMGKYRDGEPITLQLSGNYLGKRTDFDVSFDPARATTSHAFVARLWASRRIAFLIDTIRQAGAESAGQPGLMGVSILDDPRNQELVGEILRLSTQFGILTEYTAFLAREGTDLTKWGDLVTGCSGVLDNRAVRTRSGIAAVNQALNHRLQTRQAWLNYDNSYVDQTLQQVQIDAVQQLSDRAFFRRGNRWIDGRLIETHDRSEPDTVIMIGSPEHLELLRRLVGEGRQGVLSLRGQILLEVDGKSVLIQDGC